MPTDEQIKALLEGCEGVTPGPWILIPAGNMPEIYSGRGPNEYMMGPLVARAHSLKPAQDAAHIARCDPQTIAELCTRLLDAEARMKVLEDALLDWQSAAVIDVLMEGPRYMGMNRSAAERAWKKTTAALQEQER